MSRKESGRGEKMLHIILMILKIIGILVALILLFLLAAAVSILFVPLHYRIGGWKEDKEFSAKVKISWMLRSLCAEIQVQKKGMQVRIWIFGRTIEQWKKTAQNLKKKKKERLRSRQEEKKKIPDKKLIRQEEKTSSLENLDQTTKEKKALPKAEKRDATAKKKKEIAEEMPKVIQKAKKRTKSERIREMIGGWKKKIKQSWKNLKRRWNKIKRNLRNVSEKIQYYYKLYQEESTKEVIRFVKEQIIWLLHKIAPKEITGKIQFGTGDPAATGELMGVISILLPVYSYSIELEPDFENKIFEGEAQASGTVRIWYFLVIAWRVIRKKDLKKLIKRLKP